MVAVDVGDEDRLDVAQRYACSSETGDSSRRAVDNMLSIDHGKRVIAAVWHERIARSKHHHLLRHVGA